MILSFTDYNRGYRIASVATNKHVLDELLKNNLNVILCLNDKIVLYSDGIGLNLKAEDHDKLKYMNNYDVMEINQQGIAYQCYNTSSPDNALIVTDKCNSNCLMCPVSEGMRKNGQTKPLEALLEIVRHLPPFSKHITITGGEPFLLGKSIFKLFYALKVHMPETEFLLLTNGRAFSINGFIDGFIESVPTKTIVGIPLHGFNAETHDTITQAKGSFDQTFSGLKRLIKTDINVEIRIVVSKLNIDNVTEIAALIVLEFKKVWRVDFLGLEMLGNAAKNATDVWISYNDAFERMQDAIDMLVSSGIDVGIYNFPLCSITPKYRSLYHKSITDYKIRYSEACEKCEYKDACGGMFAGTIRLVNDVKPIKRI